MNEANVRKLTLKGTFKMFQSTPHSMNEANSTYKAKSFILRKFQSTPHSMNEANIPGYRR